VTVAAANTPAQRLQFMFRLAHQTFVGQVGNQVGNLPRIVNPPARCVATRPWFAALHPVCGGRIANPSQVYNLPQTQLARPLPPADSAILNTLKS
jgi:hypothetical protein